MAECTSETIMDLGPNFPKATNQRRLLFVRGTMAAQNDVITVTPLTTVEGASLIATDGTVMTMTFATNVVTLTNAAAKTCTGLVWGT